MEINIVNIKSVSVWWCFYVLRKTWATFEAEFMKKLSNTEAELKKSIAYKKKVYFSVLTKFVGIPQLLKDVIRDNKKDTKITPGIHCY